MPLPHQEAYTATPRDSHCRLVSILSLGNPTDLATEERALVPQVRSTCSPTMHVVVYEVRRPACAATTAQRGRQARGTHSNAPFVRSRTASSATARLPRSLVAGRGAPSHPEPVQLSEARAMPAIPRGYFARNKRKTGARDQNESQTPRFTAILYARSSFSN